MKEYKKVSGVLVFDSENNLALQFRAENDDSFPGHWDISAGGGVDDGESVHESAKRELQEELGIEAEVSHVADARFNYPAWDPGVEREVDISIFKANYDGEFELDPSEVKSVRRFSKEEIGQMIENGDKFHPEFILAWKKGIIGQLFDER